jgi:hypothetical protein
MLMVHWLSDSPFVNGLFVLDGGMDSLKKKPVFNSLANWHSEQENFTMLLW